MSELLPHIVVETKPNPDATVIWLHGLGANGHDFEPVVPQLGLPASSAVRFIFPHAPSMPVTINSGHVMPAWYDILEMNIDRKVDEAQLRISSRAIAQFIDAAIAEGISSERIIIAGFSQGGAVAQEAALSYGKKLGGLLLLSTYFATKNSIALAPQNREIPILIHHGNADAVVPVELSRINEASLIERGYKVARKIYSMPHAVCSEQIVAIGAWFRETLALT
ncbi:MAG: alpha/beta fold hydrolase [Cellvibrionaceae bacterium]|nr:alpha/beta fold hydrolase [Cellvibrionaceae bacterium]